MTERRDRFEHLNLSCAVDTPTVQAVPRIPVIALGYSLGLFLLLAVTFILCVGFDCLFPNPREV